jgi:peptide chain release factor subunit 1
VFDREELRELANYRDDENLICSLYYPLEKGEPTEEGGIIRLKNLINEAQAAKEEWTGPQVKSVSEDLARIEHLVIEEMVMRSGGLAVFACSAAGLWKVYHLPGKAGPLLAVDHATRMRPMIELLNRYKRYCTVLVGKGRARIFLLSPADVEERSDMFGVVPGRHDQGGWAQARYQRHHDDRVMHHLKDTADQTFALLQREEFRRLFVAGTEELVSEFVEYLHPYLKARLAGTFPMEMVSSRKEVQEQTLAAAGELREIYESEAIEKLRGEVYTGNLGAAGLEDTVHSLQKGQVLMLLVNEDFSAVGQRCTSCRSLCLMDPCPFCGATMEPLEDVVEDVVSQAFLQNCEIRFVRGANKEKLAELGGIGALLRFAG